MITIKIKTENDSFADSFSKAVNHALLQVQDIANDIEENPGKYRTPVGPSRRHHMPIKLPIIDVNGNSIGFAQFTLTSILRK